MVDRVDLDQYQKPSRDPETLAARRRVLVDQLGWLVAEAEALVPLLKTLPAWAVEQAPKEEERSVKEALAWLAVLDAEVHPGWVKKAVTEERPELTLPDDLDIEADRDLDALLSDVQTYRAALVKIFEALPDKAWSRTLILSGEETDLYGLALAITRRDAGELRTLAYRLHESNLTDRADDLPK